MVTVSNGVAIRRFALRLLIHSVLLFAALVVLFPLLALFGEALKKPGVPTDFLLIFPRQISLANIGAVWTMAPIGTMLKNSFIITTITTSIVLLLGSLAAYGFSRWKFLGSRVILMTFLLGLMLPTVALIIPLFRIVRILGLFNTYPAMILPLTALSLPFTILVMRAYFDTLPREIEEAATMDGASSLESYYRIVLPLSVPALTAVAIFLVLATWNEFLLAMVFMTAKEMRTAPLAWIYLNRFAALTWIVAPPLVFYFLLQRQFASGLTAGALRG